jgi:N-acetylglucosamine-6-phosphate deacetylase
MKRGVLIMGQLTVLINGKIYGENGTINNGFIKIKETKIAEINEMSNYVAENHHSVIDLKGKSIIPGMIDIHIHGAAGADVMDASIDALKTMTNALPQEGTTSFLATTMTQSDLQISNALKNVSEFMKNYQNPGQSEILGVHLEGPFINPDMAGAQPSEHIIKPDIPIFKKWEEISHGTIKLVTLAPEQENGLELVKYLKQVGIVVSIGHSDATFKEVKEAVDAGATQVTHLFNQMRGLHHREPGVAGAAVLLKELYAEIIADGIHVCPEMVEFAFRQKTSQKLILITDAIRAKCVKNGKYDLGGQEVTVKDGKAELANGTLAGSVLKLINAGKNMISYIGNCTLTDVIQMASVNPAKQLGIYERKGSINVGKDADIVVINDQFDIEITYCRGQLAYQKEGAILSGNN